MVNSRTACPGCSGELSGKTSHPYVRQCASCGGFVTIETLPYHELLTFVRIDKFKANARGASRYFDFVYSETSEDFDRPRRMHGWFDVADGVVVQVG